MPFENVVTQQVLFGSAVRTSTLNSGIFAGSIWRGLTLQMNITAKGTDLTTNAGLTFFLQHADGTGGTIKSINKVPIAGPMKTTGVFLFLYYVGADINETDYSQVIRAPLPAKFRFRIQAGDATPFTYSATVFYLP